MVCILVVILALAPSTDWFVQAHEHFSKANDLYKKGMKKQAFAEYCKALDKDPALKNAYFNRGLIYFYNKQYSQALSEFQDFLELKNDEPDAYYFAGLCQKLKGENLDALDSFSKAIEYKKDNSDFYQSRGYIYLRIGLYQSAIHDMDESIRINPDDVKTWMYRAYLYFLTGQYEMAVDDYTHILSTNPQDVETTVMRFLCDKKLGQNRFSLPGDLELSESDGTAGYIIQMAQGTLEPEEALSLINQQPDATEPMVHLAYSIAGEVYVIKGQNRKAVSVFNTPDLFDYPNWIYFMAQKELNLLTPVARSESY